VGPGLLGAADCGGGSSGETTLRYGIWDQTQMPAMEKIVKQFSKAHPDISGEIELTPYDEYLSKLQNAAQGGTLPIPQTRSFGSMYLASQYMAARLAGDEELDSSLESLPEILPDLLYRWEGEVRALAEEG
jgi:ABC-type glycerol-3-phosphate transport system substrate-binding protein